MSNQWLRLWHDMPTDPKWRTISKASGQAIGNVIAVYVHMLVCASNATERGRTQSFNSEDVASALDIETEQVEQIVTAMQGRVLDGDMVKGWAVRQVSREDGSAERSKAWREAKKQAKQPDSTDSDRNRTQTERKQTPDTDTDTDTDKSNTEAKASVGRATRKCPVSFIVDDAMRAWAATECPLVDLELETAKLRDHTYKTARIDWAGAWRNWLRTSQQDAESRLPKRGSYAPINKQEALEARNRAAGDEWLKQQEKIDAAH